MSQNKLKIISNVKLSMKSGEYLQAYDQSELALKSFEGNKQLQYFAVLSLARLGATEQAHRLYDTFELNDELNVDHAALGARLVKDSALASVSTARPSLLIAAAKRYEQVYRSTGSCDFYPAINAATLYFLAGNKTMSSELASDVLSLCQNAEPNYWLHASIAEAHLLRGEAEQAIDQLIKANEFGRGDWSSLAVTQKQLSLITDDEGVLETLNLPRVIHYAGHIISAPDADGGRFPADQEQRITHEIVELLDHLDVGIAYGSLASGADIIFAEEIIKRYGELHVTLPFSVEEFRQISVAPAGQEWLKRFDYCWELATSTSVCTTGDYNGDDSLFNYCSLHAMGRACLRQQHLAAPLSQVVVWDGEITKSLAGTYTDMQTWSELGHQADIIFTSPRPRSKAQGEVVGKSEKVVEPALSNKKPYSILFGDIKGFSALPDSQLPTFVRKILGCIADAIEGLRECEGSESVLMANTWGDGLFVVLKDTHVAAKCALAMQAAIGRVGASDMDFKNPVELRLGIHFGPIYEIEDPVTRRSNYFGEHVNMAARIEPITPPGQVYVTESFAAQLALSKNFNYKADYVGVMPMAKNFGDLRMYLLRQANDLT
jgi:class 3 adenylate cyclase/tetratricopeptide (TPR) repeat protein